MNAMERDMGIGAARLVKNAAINAAAVVYGVVYAFPRFAGAVVKDYFQKYGKNLGFAACVVIAYHSPKLIAGIQAWWQ